MLRFIVQHEIYLIRFIKSVGRIPFAVGSKQKYSLPPTVSLDLMLKDPEINLSVVNPPGHTSYEFENFRIDASHLMFYRDEEEISLTPKQVETLIALVERSGEIVSKDELMLRLWGTIAVEEANLFQNIHYLRKILGDASSGKPMIETLKRRGYRFNGELSEGGSSLQKVEGVTGDASAGQPMHAGLHKRRATVATLTLIGLIALIVTGYFLTSPRVSTAGDEHKTSFAVLPLAPIDRRKSDNLYEIGIADALISRLSSIRGFQVRPLSATRDYVDHDPIAAGREQEVDYVLASTYQLADGKIKVTSRLIDIKSGEFEELDKFENESSSVFAVQDAVASYIAEKLIERFGASSQGRSAKHGTANVQAYQLYLQAYSLTDRRTREDMLKAVQYLDQALQIDPNYAAAWARKALAHRYLDKPSAADNYERSVDAVNKALAIDPDLSEAYSALCDNKFNYEHDFAGAEAACKRAIELDPNSSIAHQTYAHYLSSRGRLEESFSEVETAIDLDPTSYFNRRYYANSFYLARRYDEAVAQYKQLIERDPANIGTYNWIIRALEADGKESEAFEWFIRSLTLQEQDNATIQRFESAYAASGWKGVLIERIKTPEADRGSGNPFRVAGLYARVGDKDKALEHLETCYQERNPFLTLLQYEPQFDSIRNDPRYIDLVRRIEGR